MSWVALRMRKVVVFSDARQKIASLGGTCGSGIVDLRDTEVCDSDLTFLVDLGALRSLYLGGTAISDGGIAHLEGLRNLQNLDLHDTQVTDAGLEHLKGLAELRWLNLADTNVTAPGVRQLQNVLPKVDVLWGKK